MFSSAELIEVLRVRAMQSPLYMRALGEFPPGWRAWFAVMAQHAGSVTGATADAMVALLSSRELPPAPQAVVESNRWRAFGALWRQQWQPASEDERWMRWVGYISTALIHVVLSILLLWLAYVRFISVAPTTTQGESVVQVEFIGRDLPKLVERLPTRIEQVPDRSAARTSSPPIEDQVIPIDESFSAPSQSLVVQPLQVTEVQIPDIAFVLPPTAPRDVPLLPLSAARLRLPEPNREEAPEKTPVKAVAPVVAESKPIAASPIPIEQKPIEVELSKVELSNVPMTMPEIDEPILSQRSVQLRQATVPSPEITLSKTPQTPIAPMPLARVTPQPASRAAPSKPDLRNDDWGSAQRNASPTQNRNPGLFNADGSPRLPPGTAAPGGGLPPGTVEERIADLDRVGSWLKRKPNDYQPTTLDRYWIPNETLLAEWVRRSIKEVLIPIPGTSKRIRCSVVMLALGGSCGIVDRNLLDIEATARPPPDYFLSYMKVMY